MSVVASRERRSTAGKRMTALVGKAQDEDDAFWSHETWAEDDSGNESFAESDLDSEERIDQFDSDFDESESDHEEEEEAAGAEEERSLLKEERNQKRQHKFDIAKAGRELMQKKKGKGKKRAMGDGINAGLVLNFPAAGSAPLRAATIVPPVAPGPALTSSALPPTIAPVPNRSSRSSSRPTLGKKRSLRAATVSKSQQAESMRNIAASSTSTSTKKKQRRFTQEELLLEAATVTEPENERWLLARKRLQQSENDSHKGVQEEMVGKVICKFRSRRGCLNTLSFPEMDHVPAILLARKHVTPRKPKVPTECVITGKKARYRDPKTMLGYHDMAAFKELRRRLEAGESLDQRAKKKSETDVPMLQAEQTSIETGETAPDKHDPLPMLHAEQTSTETGETVPNKHDSVPLPQSEQTSIEPGETVPDKLHSSGQIKETVVSATISASGTEPPIGALQLDATLRPKLIDSKEKQSSVKSTPNDSGIMATSTTKADVPKVVEPVASSKERRNASPRKRKPSAKMTAAAETHLFSPTKAPISNVIMNMTAPTQQTSSKSQDNPSTVQVAAIQTATNGHTHASNSTGTMISNALAMYNKIKHENN